MADPEEPNPLDGQDGAEDRAADKSRRKARMLVWLVAGCLFLVGGLDVALYLIQSRQNHSGVNLLHCLWLSIPLVAGACLLIKSSALADWIDTWLEQ